MRVISLLGSPLHENRGIHLLNFLNDYIQWKVKVDPLIWKTKLAELISYLTGINFLVKSQEIERKVYQIILFFVDFSSR